MGGGLSGQQMLEILSASYTLRGRNSFEAPPVAPEDVAVFAADNQGIFDVYLTSKKAPPAG